MPWIFRLDPDATPADAVRCLTDAANRAGANRGAIRDYLAKGNLGAGRFAFRATGELQ